LPELALFTTGRYGCEASTPAARCADAVVFASACTLNQWWLGRVLDAHLEPLMKTLHGIANVPLDLLQRAVAEGFAAARDAVATTLDVSAPRLRDC
jgi:hypothetical protein